MKVKRLAALLLAILLLAVVTGCGAGSSGATTNDMAKPEAGYADEAGRVESPSADGFVDYSDSLNSAVSNGSNLPSDAKLIYTGELTLQTTDMGAAVQGLLALINSYGGYIESQEIYHQSTYKDAYYTVRVPGVNFGAFINSISESDVCTVTYQNTTTENVGEAYADIENRLETLRIKLDRLQELLAKAESMEDIITIESSISEVEYQIELYSGEKNHYDSLINFSTVHISLCEVRSTAASVDPTLSERLSSGFKRGLSDFAEGFEDFLVWLVSNVIGVSIVIVIAVVVIVLVRRHDNKVRASRAAAQEKK